MSFKLKVALLLSTIVSLLIVSGASAQTVGKEIPSNTVTTQIGQAAIATSDCDPSASADTLQKLIKSRFGVDFQNTYDGSQWQTSDPKVYFDQKQLLAACQKFTEVSQKTKLFDLVKGVVIYPRNDPSLWSKQNSCYNRGRNEGNTRQAPGPPPAVYVYPHQDQTRFLITIFHELGHVLWNCNDINLVENPFRQQVYSVSPQKNPADNQEVQLISAVKNQGLTGYSRDAGCTFDNPNDAPSWTYITEDFAETVAYYLMPDIVERDITNCPAIKSKPYDNLSSTSHKQFIRKLLGVYP